MTSDRAHLNSSLLTHLLYGEYLIRCGGGLGQGSSRGFIELLSSNSPVYDTPWGARAVPVSVPVSGKCARSVEEVGAQA